VAASTLPVPVAKYLARAGQSSARVVPLTGDASDRRYFRVLPGDGDSCVLALHAGPFDRAALPFINVHALLAAMPVPVPEIRGIAGDLGVLALEDLGDVTLQAHLGAAPPERHAALYRQAVALIEILQRRGRELRDPAFLPYGIAFDTARLMWELDFFVKHFLEAYRGVALSASERGALHDELTAIADALAAEPRVLCHRDYHSRNLMLHRQTLYMIDFQDARLGPDTYDLVSLLRDSYIDLPDRSVDELIAYFLALVGRPGEEAAFRERFDVMALQRNLKALGTFGFQTVSRGNTVYIQYIPRTLTYVRDNLRRHARFERLAAILAGHLAELQ
jgi:aminoglycoside/choline kinase family phosphotransferase